MTAERSDREPPRPLEAFLEERAEELYEEAPCGYLSTLPDGTIVKVNGTLLDWTGYTREELVGRRRFADLLTAGGRIYHETHYAPLLELQGSVREIAVEILRADRTRLPALVNSVLKRDDQQRPLLIRTTVFDATDRKRYEHELLLARDRERAASERTARLQRITSALAARLRATDIAETVVVQLAAIAGVQTAELHLLDPIGDRVRSARSGDPTRSAAWTTSTLDQLPQDLRLALDRDGKTAADRTADTGRTVLPIAIVGQSTAALAVSTSDEQLDDDDRELVTACAAQCGLALDRALLHEQEARVSHVLQRSLLESEPLRYERIGIGTYYRPAVETLEVGGDWYDAFPAGDDRIGIVVGDVVGRGIEAATAMGQLRSATRALAGAELGGPGRVLACLDRFAARLPRALMSTLAYAEIDPTDGSTRFVCAGHPPPLLALPDAEPIVLWEGRSLPLGVAGTSGHAVEGRCTLTPGARLLLYTDGLVERRDEPIDRGVQRLAHTFEQLRAHDPQTLVDQLVEELLDEQDGRDDVCALCVAFEAPSALTSARVRVEKSTG